MIDDRAALRAGAMRHVARTALLITGLLLAACSHVETKKSTLRVYAADLAGGAKVCDVPPVNPIAGASSEAAIKVANDGGWCGISLHQAGPKPFAAGLLTTRPDHGSVMIHEVGDDTRIDYTPDRGFAGSDAFAVKLIPGDETLKVAVTVTPNVVATATPPKS